MKIDFIFITHTKKKKTFLLLLKFYNKILVKSDPKWGCNPPLPQSPLCCADGTCAGG